MRNCVDMSTLMLPAATMTTMTNTTPIAVAQPKADPVKGTLLGNNNNNTTNNKQGRSLSVFLALLREKFRFCFEKFALLNLHRIN